MPTYNDRLRHQKRRLSEKQKQLERFTKDLETAKENIKNVNKEIADIKTEIANIETRLLAEMIAQKGITIAELSAAIEAGALANVPEKPPDNSDENNCATYSTSSSSTENGNCATYSTNDNEELPEKEGLDEISGSGETLGGA